jgi:filamentous hemagglutinin
MTGIEHVFYRHGPDSGFANVSKFSQGTSVKDVSSYVDNALRYGKVTPNGPGGHVIEYDTGKVIGTNVSGAPTSTIKNKCSGWCDHNPCRDLQLNKIDVIIHN